MPVNIAIDGPSGAGKSTIARTAAQKLGFVYVDTGAMYRCVGLHVFRQGVRSDDRQRIAALLPEIRLKLRFTKQGQRVYLNGQDVSEEIRRPEISKYASDVSAIPEVRAFLLDLQRDLAKRQNVIMDGRDIGTVILPGAQIKIFLTAAPEDRAMRRYRELVGKNFNVTYEETLRSLVERDGNDSKRAAAPLRPATDAVIVDTTGNELEKSIEIILGIIRDKLREFPCH